MRVVDAAHYDADEAARPANIENITESIVASIIIIYLLHQSLALLHKRTMTIRSR